MLNRLGTSFQVKKELKKYSKADRQKILLRFFKTGPGEYGEGDKFLGLTVKEIRKVAKMASDLSLIEIKKLLRSDLHEDRLCALIIMVDQFARSNNMAEKEKIFKAYISNYKYVNNWDLVDLSAPKIMGSYLEQKERDILYKWALSKHLWKKRIAIMSTYYYIKRHEFNDTLALAKILLTDKHDLIHKAVGWMLREVGKRDRETEEEFLRTYYKKMPRTMLRYAIEKFPKSRRKAYLEGKI